MKFSKILWISQMVAVSNTQETLDFYMRILSFKELYWIRIPSTATTR